jgi:hypothetical protein
MAFTLKPLWISKPRVFLPFDRAQIVTDLKGLPDDKEYDESDYNTDVYAAVREALDVIKDEPSAVKMIVMMTDGADRPANSARGRLLAKLREEAAAAKINIVAVGIGDGFTSGPESAAARLTIDELATKPGFAFMPGDGVQAEKAHVIFVDQVQTAFAQYDEIKKDEEEERRRKLEEQRQKELEPPKVDVLPGEFALSLLSPGRELFGDDALPKPAPRAGWYARSAARRESAVAMKLDTEGNPPALAFHAYGMGRVAFWSIGGDPESAGDIPGWADFPAVFAASLRWLLPREEPDVRLVGEARPDGIRLLDPLPNATYLLRAPGGDLNLALADGVLTAAAGLPLGAAEVIERAGDEERWIGDVYVASRPESAGFVEPVDDNAAQSVLQERAASMRRQRHEWPLGALWLCTLFLVLMPVERLLRRRS